MGGSYYGIDYPTYTLVGGLGQASGTTSDSLLYIYLLSTACGYAAQPSFTKAQPISPLLQKRAENKRREF